MWILESPGDFLNGKRLWLKPGKKYLFGRVKKDGVRFAIDHKTVSRKHFIIDVAEVQDGEVAQIHTRTKIKIIDQGSKSGTSVNGHVLKATAKQDTPSRELDKTVNSVRPGTTQELVIRWQPCVVTFNLQKKDLKSGVLKQKQERVKTLGIKAIAEFAPDLTTHLVVAKRNTPKGLQALITGKFLVSESFLDAIEYAATPTNLDGDDDASLLEHDFDSAWPVPKDHLPAPGREPTVRPVESYQPGPDRSHIFERYSFVFGDQSQYDTLLSVITTGHGKALLSKVVEGETTVDELCEYMQNVRGKKTPNVAHSPSETGGTILVRWDSKSDNKEWTSHLINQVALRMDQRAIDQSEFLDAILANDASLLRQAVPYESTTEGRVAPPPSMIASSFRSIREPEPAAPVIDGNTDNVRAGSPSRSQVEATATQVIANESQRSVDGGDAMQRTRKDRIRMPPPPTQAFDDSFNPDDIVPWDEDEDEEVVGVRDSSDEDVIKPEPQSTRKRRRSPSPAQNGDSFEEEMDNLLPAATAMKRRKLEMDAVARRQGLFPPTVKTEMVTPLPQKRKKDIEIDVREVARAQRERELKEAEKKRERLENLPPIDETDRAPANLAIVEELDIPVRKLKISERLNPEDDPRWDPKWNGRKNFKKFQPQTATAGPPPSNRVRNHASKVFVRLVEVKRKSNGIGEQYWEKTDEERERQRKRKEKEKARTQRAQAALIHDSQTARGTDTEWLDYDDQVDVMGSDNGEEEDDDARRTSPDATRLQDEAEMIVDGDVDMDSPRRTRGDDARIRTQTQTQTQTQAKAGKRTQTQTQSTTQTQSRGVKRPPPKTKAATTMGGQAKRQKTLPVVAVHGSGSDDDDDDDDDGLAFKPGRRKARLRG